MYTNFGYYLFFDEQLNLHKLGGNDVHGYMIAVRKSKITTDKISTKNIYIDTEHNKKGIGIVCLYVKIGDLHLFNVHFNEDCKKCDGIYEMNKLILDSNKCGKVIISGDFNNSPCDNIIIPITEEDYIHSQKSNYIQSHIDQYKSTLDFIENQFNEPQIECQYTKQDCINVFLDLSGINERIKNLDDINKHYKFNNPILEKDFYNEYAALEKTDGNKLTTQLLIQRALGNLRDKLPNQNAEEENEKKKILNAMNQEITEKLKAEYVKYSTTLGTNIHKGLYKLSNTIFTSYNAARNYQYGSKIGSFDHIITNYQRLINLFDDEENKNVIYEKRMELFEFSPYDRRFLTYPTEENFFKSDYIIPSDHLPLYYYVGNFSGSARTKIPYSTNHNSYRDIKDIVKKLKLVKYVYKLLLHIDDNPDNKNNLYLLIVICMCISNYNEMKEQQTST